MKRWWWTLCVGLVSGACTQDSPTGVGGELLPPDAVQTWEITLESSRLFSADTSFGLYSRPSDAPYVLLAEQAEGGLSSHTLVRFAMPGSLVLPGPNSTAVVDSFPTFLSGSLRLAVDTTLNVRQDARIELYRTTEDWDRTSATWTLRVDTPGARVPWTEPGGSPGMLVGVGNYVAGSDSIIIPVDSATLAVWADRNDPTRGGVITMGSAGQRLRASIPTLRVRARASVRDTIVDLTVVPGRTFIFTPELPESVAGPRVGGTPEWRTILLLRQGLDTLTVACPPGSAPTCRVRLRDVTINFAGLRLQPRQSPPGFRPEAPLDLTINAVLPVEGIPLQRSPLTEPVGRSGAAIPVSSFTAPGAPAVEIPLTSYLSLVFSGDDSGFGEAHLALVQSGSVRTFGFGTFEAMPTLRLILTTARELQLP